MSKVYFVAVEESEGIQSVRRKLEMLLDESKILDFIRKDEDVAVKIHFGEEGNVGHVRPEYARLVSDRIRKRSAKPFFTDTNTLYRGKRTNLEDHKRIAHEHGFTPDICGADIVIPDDTNKANVADVAVNGSFIKTAKVVKLFLDADVIVDIAHFKGHLMTGFGGALKNIGMGCATIEGKLAQHSDLSPIIDTNSCTACMECAKVCPTDAIYSKGHAVYIDSSKCIGCASCIAACTHEGIDVDWEAAGDDVGQKMAEYSSAILKNKKGKCAFINFAMKITKECDCLAKDDPRISPDIGIFASLDPVAIDKACFDSVVAACGKDIFKEAHPKRDGIKQLHHAQRIGLGEMDYDLCVVRIAEAKKTE